MTEDKSRAAALTEASPLLAVLFLGTNPVAVKVAVAELPPMPFVAVRFTVAGLLLLGLVALLETGGRPGGRDPRESRPAPPTSRLGSAVPYALPGCSARSWPGSRP